MIATQASCGHFAVFSEAGAVLNRSCACPDVFLPGSPAAIVAGDLPIASRRKTSNSRGPGQEGTVYIRPDALRSCPKCKRVRHGSGPHAPHHAGGQLVDCAGDPVAEGARR